MYTRPFVKGFEKDSVGLIGKEPYKKGGPGERHARQRPKQERENRKRWRSADRGRETEMIKKRSTIPAGEKVTDHNLL